MIRNKEAKAADCELQMIASQVDLLTEMAYRIADEPKDAMKMADMIIGVAGLLEDISVDLCEEAEILERTRHMDFQELA